MQTQDCRVLRFRGHEELACRLALEADLIILDLVGGAEVAALVLQTLLAREGREQAHVICLSSIHTWGRTAIVPLRRDVRDNKTLSSEPGEIDDKKLSHSKAPVPVSRYANREPQPDFYYVYELERMAEKIKKQRPQLILNIVCPGLVYGLGELDLLGLFEELFANKEVTCYEHAKTEVVPLIHIKDLVEFIDLTIRHRPSSLFLAANEGYSHATKE